MIGIGLRFTAGRFHATPWGRHVNEGVPEWPPSPWRLLRSMIWTWKVKVPQCNEIQLQGVFQQLATLPSYILPPASPGHTRHYMRWYKKGPEDQTLVFDAFASLDKKSELYVIWPDAELNQEQVEMLDTIISNLGYLGRAESWCEGRLLSSQESQKQWAMINCFPSHDQPLNDNQELVQVLCPDPESAFDNSHVIQKKTVGKGKNKQTIDVSIYDPPWNLCIDTAQLHQERWSDPPGSRWVHYVRRSDCFEPPAPSKKMAEPRDVLVHTVRFALDSTVLPLLTQTLPIAEAFRRAAIYQCVSLEGRTTYGRAWSWPKHKEGEQPVDLSFYQNITGKDNDKNPLQGYHGHAYYLPTDEDGDGRLDHITVVSSNGFTRKELCALDRLRYIKRTAELPELRVLMMGYGALDEFIPFPLKPSRTWVSATPFMVTRCLKKRGKKRDPRELFSDPARFVETVLREELQRFCEHRVEMKNWGEEQIVIEPLVDENGVFYITPHSWQRHASSQPLRPIQFKRYRQKKGDDGGKRYSGSFILTFPEAIRGPVVLGHSSHFGMGLFLPMDECTE
jgi:CRISPR-associated protein Csb2